MKIDEVLIPAVYEIAKDFYSGKITLNVAKQTLTRDSEINPNSLGDYLYNFKYLMDGTRFTRTLNAFSMEYFLDNIFKDYGNARLSNALNALEKHIEYYENIQNTTMHVMRRIHKKFLALIPSESEDEKEQNEIIYDLKLQQKSKDEILQELRTIKETDAETIVIKGTVFKRDNRTVAQIKILRDFKCQICKTSIIKKDGTEYVEAAHITPKHQKGRETLDNIILLCPNHHKEFDLGNRVILNHTASAIEFSLNGNIYNLSLIK